jgi:hypothetical protein
MNHLRYIAVFFLLLAQASGQDVATYKANGLKYGRQHAQAIAAAAGDDALSRTYYDALWCYQQLADATGEKIPLDGVLKAYRDNYVIANNGGLPGYWSFTDGLTEHHLRTGDPESKRAALLIANNAAYHVYVPPSYPPVEWTQPASASRETAYAIINFLNAERLGEPRKPLLARYVDQTIDHLDQWSGRKSMAYVQPFMVGLTATALVRYHDQVVKDPRIVPALKRTADWLWKTAWRENAWSFYYQSTDPETGAPDLNMLILPLYAFVYRETGEAKYREQAIQIFDGGVRGSWLDGPKQFNQTYLRGFEALKWLDDKATLKARIKELEAKLQRVREAAQ